MDRILEHMDRFSRWCQEQVRNSPETDVDSLLLTVLQAHILLIRLRLYLRPYVQYSLLAEWRRSLWGIYWAYWKTDSRECQRRSEEAICRLAHQTQPGKRK